MGQERQQIGSVIEELQDTLELFYQQKEKEALDSFGALIDRLMEAMNTLFSYKKEHEDFEVDERKLTTSLKDALAAMEEKDYILLADILQYDFLEYMQELVGQLS